MTVDYLSSQREKPVVALFGEILADVFPDEVVLGGAPFNVARHLQAFGLHPVMLTRTGQDALREDLLREMERLGMDTTGVQLDQLLPTGQVQVHLEKGGHCFEILPDQAYDNIHAGLVRMVTMSIKPDLVYFGTLAQRSMPSRLALDKMLSGCRCPRFLDINLRKPWYNKHTVRRSLQRCDVAKVNIEELDIIANYFKINASTDEEKAQMLMAQFGLQELIVTCGKNGAWMLGPEGLTKTSRTRLEKPLMDTVGAGDAFAAVIILGKLRKWPQEVTLKRADQFAGAVCGIRGAAPDSLDFYAPFYKGWNL